jgi:hypothetical protein
MSNPYSKFEEVVANMKGDFEKFYDKENNAAGTRVRKALQELGALCKDVRKDVTEVKNARKEAK